MSTEVTLPAAGLMVKLVPRGPMKANGSVRRMRSVADADRREGEPLPPAPPTLDLSKGRSVPYPMLGNDRYGDCYYVSAVKHVTTWTAGVGAPKTWTTEEVVRAYLALAGGDNGLTDSQIMGEWLKGLCRTDHKRMSYMVVPDAATARLAAYLFGGLQFTLGIPNRWLQIAQSGATWDAKSGDRPNPNNGHAVLISGYDSGDFNVETWGFGQPINMTDAALRVCDPEFLAVFSRDMFDARGIAPNGFSFKQLAAWWQALGGEKIGPSPFPDDPTPPPPPPPPPSGGFTGSLLYDAGMLKAVAARDAFPSSFDWQGFMQLLQLILELMRKGHPADKIAQLIDSGLPLNA